MTDIRLTEPQVKALMALPADGSWLRVSYTSELSGLRCDGLVASNIFAVGHCYRLTPAGIAERKKREGAPK